jgi:twitching motility protein PilJ
MAKNTDTSTIFRTTAIVTAVLLLAAGALAYLQGKGSNPQAAELAALSQAIPTQAGEALNGAEGGFARLDASLERLLQLRRGSGPGIPGSQADWQQLESQAAAILAKRSDVEAMDEAGTAIADGTDTILGLSNELLDRSGATAIIQEFQQRAARMGRAAPGLATNPNAGNIATGIADDAAFLRTVADALSGEATELDVRPLDNEGREVALIPIINELSIVQAALEIIESSVSQVSGLTDVRAELAGSATSLGVAFTQSAGGGPLPAFLQIIWIPLALIAVAVILVISLMFLNSRSATFEQTAKEQAEQNERNQQAILRLLDEMGSLADGDLTVEATVNETAIMVDSAAKQTESTASHMAKAADNQGREINAATESIVSMAASIEEVSGNAERSSDVARHSVEVAHKLAGDRQYRRTDQ